MKKTDSRPLRARGRVRIVCGKAYGEVYSVDDGRILVTDNTIAWALPNLISTIRRDVAAFNYVLWTGHPLMSWDEVLELPEN